MNILMLSWRGPGHPNAGGAEISTYEHAKRWVKAGHKVTLFTSAYVGGKQKEILDGIQIIRDGSQVLGVHLKAFLWYLFKDHPQYDIVIDQFHGIPFFTSFYVRTKKLAFIHEVAKEVWGMNFNLIPAILGEFFEPWIFKLYKDIPFITVSQSSKKDLIDWMIPAKNITVIQNGITVPHIKKFPAKEKIKTIIFLGAISKDKGIEDALNVFSIINNKERNWQFWVAGKSDSNYLKKLKILSKKLKIEKNVNFFDYVSERKKYNLLSRAHILINPSVREGWGLVVIEAAVMGTPTVAFDVPGLRDSIIDGKTGVLSGVHDIESLAKIILDLTHNQNRYNKMCKNAKIWGNKFSWEKAAKESLRWLT